MQKIDPESISKEIIKENLYSSTFLSPDLLISTGPERRIGDLLLWDSWHARLFPTGQYWIYFTQENFLKALEYYTKD